MGEVWRGRDERLNRMVAIKILPPDVANDPPRRARFTQEAKALAALNHPNILSIFEFGEDRGQVFMVSELVDGESLRAMVDRGPVPSRKAIEIAVQIADGLAAAHSLQVVHRDLKPENVMVTRSGQVKLLDFGLAKQGIVAEGDRTASMALSAPGTVMGTAGYMSPEQVRGEPVDTRSDIFSFGCVLYEMLTGKRAFKAPSGIETMHAILHAEPEDFQGETKAPPPALAVIVRRCMEKQPSQRFQSAADLAFALRAVNTTTTTLQPVLAEPPKPARRRWFWPAIGALAVLAILAVLASGFLLRDRFSRRELVQYQPLTFRKGYIARARFTPDAHSVVYSGVFDNGRQRTYLAIPGNSDSRDLELPDDLSLEAVSSTQQLA